eukprot:9480468-Pyramimonas_sp.AAC.1
MIGKTPSSPYQASAVPPKAPAIIPTAPVEKAPPVQPQMFSGPVEEPAEETPFPTKFEGLEMQQKNPQDAPSAASGGPPPTPGAGGPRAAAEPSELESPPFQLHVPRQPDGSVTGSDLREAIAEASKNLGEARYAARRPSMYRKVSAKHCPPSSKTSGAAAGPAKQPRGRSSVYTWPAEGTSGQ